MFIGHFGVAFAVERVGPRSDMAAPMSQFRLCVRARPEDIDELAHVSNIVYVRWIQEVAVAHSTSVGWPSDAYLRLGKVFVVRRHEIDFIASAVEDDEIDLVTWIAEWSPASSVRRTRILRGRDGQELARATTVWAFVSKESGRPQRILPEIVEAFGLSAVQ